MTADIKPLPLPKPDYKWMGYTTREAEAIVRANVVHATAAKDAEIAKLVNDRDDLLARLDASIDHGTKLGAAQQRCLDEVLELKDEIETLRADKSELEAALESLKAHMGNAVMNRDGIIKALEEVRDEQGDEIHRLRAEVETLRDGLDYLRQMQGAPDVLKLRAKADRDALRDHDQEVSND